MDLSALPLIASLQIAPLSQDLSRGLFVTWAGMLIVFSVLIVLTLMMLGLGRIFRPGPDEE
jgi:Na+-transporting methylmalonyl-CoA/oxaloacetate decarboxylase gamma subunit